MRCRRLAEEGPLSQQDRHLQAMGVYEPGVNMITVTSDELKLSQRHFVVIEYQSKPLAILIHSSLDEELTIHRPLNPSYLVQANGFSYTEKSISFVVENDITTDLSLFSFYAL